MRTRVPPAVAAAAAIGGLLLLLPLLGLLVRVPWSRAADVITDHAVLDALRISLVCSASATVISLVVGVPLAWVIARARPAVRRVLRAVILIPLVLPPVVGGIALLQTFGRRGIAHDVLPFARPFTTSGVVLAETFVALPLLVVTVEAALRAQDGRLNEAAATLGLGPWSRFLRIDLVASRGAIVAGSALCFARALGEFGATITYAGNLPGTTQTLPLATYLALEQDVAHALVLSVLLLVVSLLVLVGLRDRWIPALQS
ncbi:MAG TPA: molybdate ABC transporter permease subunit [Mycobacteriales bacterium]|nr:molybdate ABC transporter permease subunit [Mycobacteriales bacterium]